MSERPIVNVIGRVNELKSKETSGTAITKRFSRYGIIAATLIAFAHAQPSDTYIPSTISPAWQEALRNFPPTESLPLPGPDDVEGWAEVSEAFNRAFIAQSAETVRQYGSKISEQTLGGIPVLEVTPGRWTHRDQVVVYVHGGAYTLGSARAYLGSPALFAEKTGRRVIAVDYTLAPAAKWRKITAEVVAVTQALETNGYPVERTALYGDSAGGSLAAGVTLKLRNEGMGMPAALVLWSPWSDITQTGDTYQTLKDADPILTYPQDLEASAAAYADPAEQKHPYVSPVYGDFAAGFPPTLIQAGTKEIFLSNAVRLYQTIEAAGGSATLDIYEGMPHVFQYLVPESPETTLAMSKVATFLDEHLGERAVMRPEQQAQGDVRPPNPPAR